MGRKNTVVIITATFNRADRLENLYDSLKKQDNHDFRWIIVNDGSTDGTEEKVTGFLNQGIITIEYVLKENSGKSASLNKAFDRIGEKELALIVDDDEYLDQNAVSSVYRYYDRYYGTDVGVIHFYVRDADNDYKIIANYEPKNDFILDYRTFKSKGMSAEGYFAYFGYAIQKLRFPIFRGEKYVGPSVLLMMVGNSHEVLWANETIGTTRYLAGGLTKQGRFLRVKNPLGMMAYCVLNQSDRASAKVRLKYSVMGYAYQYISGKTTKELQEQGIEVRKLRRAAKIPGIVLGILWKKKYRRK